MNPAIIALACATPPHSTGQSQAARFAIESGGLSADSARFAEVIYRRSGVQRRASCLLDSTTADTERVSQRFHPSATSGEAPTTGERMARYAVEAVELAFRASSAALSNAAHAGITPSDITHIVTVSCTGFTAPGIDHALIERLHLRRTVSRLHIGYMGCHGAINALAAARNIIRSEPNARVLVVCVELCSLHFQVSDRPDQIVANALFADGAVAMIITADTPPTSTPLARIAATGGCVFNDSAEAMGWRIGDHGFEMTLGESVPRLIEGNLRPWLAAWLDSQGQSLTELIAHGDWAIHPGGPRVLDAVANSLGLSEEAMRPSREILAAHGNMSSPTVLFILDRIARQRKGNPRPAVLVAFGPGLSAEAALLTH